jgi:glycosyltransferase involved in cell wall biosynthesis
MRLLYITPELPWPLTSGHVRHYHFLRELGQRHEVVLLSLARPGAATGASLEELKALVERVEPVERAAARSRAARAVELRQAAGRLAAAARRVIASDGIDAVLLAGKETSPALDAAAGLPLVIDICDATSVRLRGQAAIAAPALRASTLLRLARIRAVERRLLRATSHVLFASERDRRALMGAGGGGHVVPNGVDVEHFRRLPGAAAAPACIAFTGVMAYEPNRDAATRLAGRVLPLVREAVPAAELVLAGRDPGPRLQELARTCDGVTVTGTVPDLRPHLERATVYCAPLRFGAGIQNKLLEAMAMELPVVTTPLAAAGLRSRGADPPLLVAEDDAAIGDAVVRLLRDPRERAALATAGREYVERHFSWQRSARTVEAVLAQAVERGGELRAA